MRRVEAKLAAMEGSVVTSSLAVREAARDVIGAGNAIEKAIDDAIDTAVRRMMVDMRRGLSEQLHVLEVRLLQFMASIMSQRPKFA